MIISPQALIAAIEHDLSIAKSIYNKTQDEAKTLEEVAYSDALGTGQAATAFRSLIQEVRLPAVYCIQDAVMEYIEDIRANESAAKEAFRFSGLVVDLEQMEFLLQLCHDRINECAYLKEDTSLDPGVTRAADNTLFNLMQLRSQLDMEIVAIKEYLNNSSLYVMSQAYMTGLAHVEECIRNVAYNAQTGTYNLDGVDLSWRPKFDDAWWKKHNRRILEQYFILSKDGEIIGIQSDALPRLLELSMLIPECLFSSGLPEKVGTLTGAEKYALLVLVYNLAPSIYGVEKGAVHRLTNSSVIGDRVFQQLPWHKELKEILQDLYNHSLRIDLMKSFTSFSFENGRFFTSDSPGSIQHRNGFADVYDKGEQFLGMDLDTYITTFEYNGKEYRIQEWDGSYMAGIGYGGEIAVYSRDMSPNGYRGYHHMANSQVESRLDCLTSQEVESQFIMYKAVRGDQVPKMQVTVHTIYSSKDDRRYKIEGEKGDTSWSFNGKARPVDKDGLYPIALDTNQLYVTATVDFKNDIGLAQAAYDALKKDGINVQLEGTEITVSYDAKGRD
ncbi:DUF4474 domain-containing protein [Lancefieldella rimae]